MRRPRSPRSISESRWPKPHRTARSRKALRPLVASLDAQQGNAVDGGSPMRAAGLGPALRAGSQGEEEVGKSCLDCATRGPNRRQANRRARSSASAGGPHSTRLVGASAAPSDRQGRLRRGGGEPDRNRAPRLRALVGAGTPAGEVTRRRADPDPLPQPGARPGAARACVVTWPRFCVRSSRPRTSTRRRPRLCRRRAGGRRAA